MKEAQAYGQHESQRTRPGQGPEEAPLGQETPEVVMGPFPLAACRHVALSSLPPSLPSPTRVAWVPGPGLWPASPSRSAGMVGE